MRDGQPPQTRRGLLVTSHDTSNDHDIIGISNHSSTLDGSFATAASNRLVARPTLVDHGGRSRLGASSASSSTRVFAEAAVRGRTHSVSRTTTQDEKKPSYTSRAKHAIANFARFIGPGFMIAVAYIDPGNYATDIAAGATYRFNLLFIVLLSNLFAIFLQSLSIKLGTVSGLNLAEACRAFLPRWLNWSLYGLAEIAIIATDMAEVIGTAIAINLLIPQIPLIAGCALSILDVMIILIFYRPSGSMRGLRAFELFVVLLVLAVVVCFCIQMSLIRDTPVGEVFRGYIPSHAIIEQQGLYQACGILGATVMPHSLYLGSGIVQSRLREYDEKHELLPASLKEIEREAETEGQSSPSYLPSLESIRHGLKYSISELAISLFTFALFINSAILIVAGAALYQNPDAVGADIFAVHDLLSRSLGVGAGTLFALALLLSGISAGIVCTIAGQMVSEGALNWSLKPWIRRLITRSISIAPSIVVAGAVGREGLDAALTGSQIALSCVLPFITAPLIYFTCLNRYMTVQEGGIRRSTPVIRVTDSTNDDSSQTQPCAPTDSMVVTSTDGEGSNKRAKTEALGSAQAQSAHEGEARNQREDNKTVKMANSLPVAIIAVVVWLVITGMNVANLVLLGQQSNA